MLSYKVIKSCLMLKFINEVIHLKKHEVFFEVRVNTLLKDNRHLVNLWF